jgi:hypothetical protein
MGLLDFIFGESKDDLRAKVEYVRKKNKAQLAENTSLQVSFKSKQQELEKIIKELTKKLNTLRHETGAAKRKIKQDAEIKINQFQEELERVTHEAEEVKRKSKEDMEIWKASLREKSTGFPTLLNAIKDYEAIRDEETENQLRQQKRPAQTAADKIKEANARRRATEFVNKKTQSIIEYYENIAPFLLDFKDEIIDENDQTEDYLRDYTDEEKKDEVTKLVAKPEYIKLTPLERNQLALDRYWEKWKTKKEIGRLYECYVGYLYESKGYDVEYSGNIKGFEDLGRDLICKKNDEVIIIQCKNWSTFKTIFEKHIFQFFGTVFQYKQVSPEKSVIGKFYTSTRLSDLARSFASEFKIELKENFPLVQYPCIKGNISRGDNEKIYHLPFDQQYDKIKVELNKGEKFFQTVQDAESEGFRRAKRWIVTNE